MSSIKYQCGLTEKPPANGVYAVRVRCIEGHDLLQDEFLLYYNGKWSYLGSDQQFRRTVFYFLGPLERPKIQEGT